MTVLTEFDQFNNLKNGDPILFKTTVPLHKSRLVKKGDTVKVVYEKSRLNATIISDPVVIVSMPEEGYHEISIEVIKSEQSAHD